MAKVAFDPTVGFVAAGLYGCDADFERLRRRRPIADMGHAGRF